jgi:hypothetical protein
MKKYPIIAIITIYALLSGCATVPMASINKDNMAKQFRPIPNKSVLPLF